MSLQIRGQVISTEREDGSSFMAPDVLIFRYPREQVTSKSIIIVQPQENCVVVIQGQVQAVLPPGTHNIQSPQNPLSSFMARFRYNQLPFDTIAFFVSMTRHEVRIQGKSQTDDLVPLDYEVAVYYRVTDAPKLVVNIQFAGLFFKDADLAAYLAPVIDQEVSSILNQVKLVEVYKRFSDISTAVTAALKQFLSELGVELISVRVTRLIPEDPELRRIIQLRDLGLDVEKAVRMGLARILTEQGNPASVNMAIGTPYYPNLSTLVNLPERMFQVTMGGGKNEQDQSKSS
ncbi:MAG: SPFH domain-containing protein [Metallosphaera yellowstonensis]|jgi:regulator of protease activity HflC (stomatin/prohibitin superfamily)|uniref:Membrane protease subunit, stomatin/prohibitin n=1 Tax=Metallosphaera yellowstonensis MK1 TaxID=671065 RepID=H2C2Q0_9CREN|nr:SPFH domain-containing protein [Metallosphaera yellowstonensis]EHP70521.1 membrane protease subunit, stomatin/prohibitin [Metallosphaera yellowstonensis MK1]